MDPVEKPRKIVMLKNGRTRCLRSKQERRRIVEETLQPGASVALVARQHELNANLLFVWRKQYQQGFLDDEAKRASALLRVKIGEPVSADPLTAGHESRARKVGTIDIDLGHARLRIEGAADPECVRAAVEGLLR